MKALPCSFFTLRVVPHPHTGEGAPVAIVLQSRPAEYLGLRAILDVEHLRRIAPDVDVELLARYLRSFTEIADGLEAAGGIALMSRPERFYWLAAPRSDVLQPTPVEHRTCDDPAALADALFRERVEVGSAG